MVNLDDLLMYQQNDPGGMLDHIHRMPGLCQQAWRMALDFDLPGDYSRVNKVVILGLGGSAIGGDLVSSLLAGEAKLPIITFRGYAPPAFVDGQTLVIASSYSGMTEETLSSFQKTLAIGARTLAITTDGKLKTLAEEKKIPVFTFDYRAPPRAALPYSILPILGFLQKLGLIKDKSADVAEAIQVLEKLSQRMNEEVAQSQNAAKQLAQKCYGHLLVIYGAELTSEVAHRWKTQFNENSKTWAFYEVFPELNHNAIMAYKFPGELADKIMVMLLDSALLSGRIKTRYQVTGELLAQAKVEYQCVAGEGSSALSQMMSLVLFGDYVSYYLAILNKIDPTPVENIAYLKKRLAEAGEAV